VSTPAQVRSAGAQVRSLSGQEPVTIVHVTAPARVGGLERVVVALAKGQRAAGHRVHVVAVLAQDEPDHPFVEELSGSGITVHAPVIQARAYGRERAFIKNLCTEVRPTVVHTHGYRPDVVDSGVARAEGIATVSTVHGFTRGRGRGQVYEWMQRRALRRFDAVVCVSRPQLAELQKSGVPGDRLHLIPNAWSQRTALLPAREARAQLNAPADVFHVGFVGRLTQEKGADVLVRALTHLTDVPIVVSFIGSGNERERIEAEARRAGVVDRIRWHGMLPDASQLFAAFDVFVMSSRTEGTPIALFEAIAAGVPVITTAVGGIPDVVSQAEALLVPSEDPQALGQAIRAVRSDGAGARSRALAALERLGRVYTVEPWLSRYESLYRYLHTHRKPVNVS
jgi:glycosyltransferase involved in cell wall biosynthesis